MHKYIKGTEYTRTYKAVDNSIQPVKDSKTALQETIAYPQNTIEEKFDKLIAAGRHRVASGENVEDILKEFNEHFWRVMKITNVENYLKVYGIELPLYITEQHLAVENCGACKGMGVEIGNASFPCLKCFGSGQK